MSTLIHIAEKPQASAIALRVLCITAAAVGLLWYALQSENTPADTPSIPPPPVAAVYRLPPPTAAQTAAARMAAPLSPAPVVHTTRAPAADTDYATRNAHVDVRQLTASRPLAARSFLNEVLLAPGAHGSYTVAEVLPDSRYERLGLRPGDVIYSLDTPKMAAVDESSMESLMCQSEIELDVYRQGTLTRLQHSLASTDEQAHAAQR